MAITNDATVNAFYLAYYGRPADPAGLAYWSEALATSNGDFSSIISAFSTSSEATAHIGTGTATDQITNVYQQLFGHAPDAAGLAYWTDAISSGNMSLADAAFQITQGAQTSDLTVSTLRQEAAAQFTATVAASGVAYDGDAGIAAGRVMIAAVNATSSAADIKSLVTAGASLAQTAHDNPAVITALANGGDLSTLLSTASGQSDPVALIQALASIGKAALTDSAGLTTLLKGGGVAGLLASLPAGTTIKDVAAAVDKGGLAAGTTVVTTPVSSTPDDTPVVITPKIAFVGIDGKDLPAGTTLEANSIWYYIDIHGKPANSTNTFQVSSTGTGDWKTVSEDTLLDNGTYYVRYIVKDAAGNSGTSNTLKLVMDNTLTSPVAHLSVDSGVPDDLVTNNRDVEVTGLRPGAAWSYSFDGKTWTPGTANDAGLNVVTDKGTDGVHTVHIRTLENVSGNSAFTSTDFKYTLDTTAPAVPTVAMGYDSGTKGDTITNNGSFIVSGLEQNGTFDYSLDGGQTWTLADALPSAGTAYVNLGEGEHTVTVRAYDAAGNVSAASAPLHYTVNLAPLNGLKLDHVEGGVAGSVETTEAVADVVFSYTGQFVIGDTLTYQIDDTEGTVSADNLNANSAVITVDTVHHTITLHDVDLTAANPYVGISSSNAAGDGSNAGAYIVGPFSYYFANQSAAGIELGARVDGRHVYLTDNGTSVEIGVTKADDYTNFGAQENVLKGVLGVGTSAASRTENNTVVYALGTNKGDTISGSHVWGFDGDDTITAVGDSNHQAMIYGGSGADIIHTESVSSIFGFTSASDSSIATDSGANSTVAAHGFDTLYVGGAGNTTQIFNFKIATPGYFTSIVGADHGAVLTGGESGSELLTLLNTAMADALTAHAGIQQAALIDFGMVDDKHVDYLVVDNNADGHISADDYVVKVIGSVSSGELQSNSIALHITGAA